jgi:hypothetical protein
MLGAMGERPTISAQCIFVDPIANIAILSSPGDAEYRDEVDHERYEALTNSVAALKIADIAPSARKVEDDRYEAPVWVPSRTGEFIPCTVSYMAHVIGHRAILDPMSIWGNETPREDGLPSQDRLWSQLPDLCGAPILTADGSAVGVLIGGNENPRLTHNLPAWFLNESSPSRMSAKGQTRPSR